MVLVSGFPFMSPLPRLMASGSPNASLYFPPSLGVSHSGKCCLALYMSLFAYLPSCVSRSGQSRGVLLSGGLLFAFTWLPSLVSYHLSADSSISQLICLQSSVNSLP